MNQAKPQNQRKRIETELRRIAFANAGDYQELTEDEQGRQRVLLRPLHRLRPAQRSAVASLKQGKDSVELKLKNPLKALELLCKLYGLFNDAPGAEATGQLDALMEGLRQLDEPEEDDDDL